MATKMRRDSIQDLDAQPSEPATFSPYDGPKLCLFQPVTEEEIRKLVVESPTQTCMLDPIPASLIKECLSDLLSLITRIVNSSLCSGVVPSQFKQAVVTPMLKKPGLDPNDLTDFRPMSNLPFISKILEKVVLTQLQKYLRNADDRLVSVLALLDLSAAFDRLDHPILLQRLETTFGISDTVLHWFASCLEGREQSVKVDNVLSSPSPLQFGVPQGSVLGSILFTLYSQPLSDLICRHECDYHKYADDAHLSKGAPPDQFQSLLCDIQTCTESLVGWMYSNKLSQTKCRKDRSSSRCIYLQP